jgi:hypothetical protein
VELACTVTTVKLVCLGKSKRIFAKMLTKTLLYDLDRIFFNRRPMHEELGDFLTIAQE